MSSSMTRFWGYSCRITFPSRVDTLFVASASSHSSDKDEADSSGDPKLQDALVSMVKLEIGKKRVEEYVEDSGERLKEKAESAKEDLDKLEEVARARGALAFDSAMADINREADEFEEQLRRSREELERKDKEQTAWEKNVAKLRSEGQFFKRLYEEEGEEDPKSDGFEFRASKVQEPAKEEIGSPVRTYLFLALAFLLAADVGADIASEYPSYGPDALYTGLAALSCWLAMNERASRDE